MNMHWIDWLIVIIPVMFVIGVGVYSRRYVRGVSDFLSAGRVCGRYVISVGDMAGALSIIGLVAYVEVHYKTGFALLFWGRLTFPVSVFLGLAGFCTYRFRATKAMSLGQFLEMRYNRPFRIFAATLRSISEILANMIMPAIAARFFIYFLDLPETFNLFGLAVPTFMAVMLVCLSVAVGLICLGGTLTLIVTDVLQGMLSFPIIAIFVVFILTKFDWSGEIVPVMMDRVPGESFLNPFDLSKLRDFNLFFVFVTIFITIFHRASWIGSGTTTAARSPHEQKMAGILGAWRNAVQTILYVLIAVAIITVMNHASWAPESKQIRDGISSRIAEELVEDDANRAVFNERIAAVPVQVQEIGVDQPLSQKENLDTPLLDTAHETFVEFEGDADGNERFQEFRTLYLQMMMSMSMREMLPPGLMGLFCLLMVMVMISTDDTRIFSSAITLSQDVILPLRKKEVTPKQHVRMLRIVSVCVGAIFFCGSYFMAQLDYIQLFVTIVISMWLGGCGPVMVFGLYGRFGTTAGAFASLISGMLLSLGGIFLQRNWAGMIYPWLEEHNAVESVGNFLTTVSKPLDPYVVWEMNAVKFPINSYEIFFMTMMVSLFLYCTVSFLTRKEPFNLDRMLHRGIYDLDADKKDTLSWSPRTMFSKMIGITKEYTTGDKFLAWFIFVFNFVVQFLVAILGAIIWNAVSPWPVEWWGTYFFIFFLIIPCLMSIVATFLFGIGGVIDLRRMFRDLKNRADNPLDNGQVEGHVSISDKAQFEEREHDA